LPVKKKRKHRKGRGGVAALSKKKRGGVKNHQKKGKRGKLKEEVVSFKKRLKDTSKLKMSKKRKTKKRNSWGIVSKYIPKKGRGEQPTKEKFKGGKFLEAGNCWVS